MFITVFITVCIIDLGIRMEELKMGHCYGLCVLCGHSSACGKQIHRSESVQVWAASEKGEPTVLISSPNLCSFFTGCIIVQLLESFSSSPEALFENVLNQKVSRLTRTSLLVFMMSAGFTRTFNLTRGRSIQIHK